MDEGATSVFKVLSHPLRVRVLELLSEQRMRYTDILEELGVETGKLNFHLRKLDGYVDTEDDTYALTERGVEALRTAEDAEQVTRAAPVIWSTPSLEAAPTQRLKALTIDVALFVGIPFLASLLVMLSIPVQLSASDPLLYLMAGWNPGEHLLTGTLLLLAATAVGEAYSGATPGKSVVGIRVVRGDGPPPLSVSLARAFVTVYLLPLDFLAARAAGMDELRLTDRVLELEVVEGRDDSTRSGPGGSTRKETPVATPEAA